MSRHVPSAALNVLEACTDSPLVDVARSIDGSTRALRFNKDDARRLARYVQDLVVTLDGFQQERDGAEDAEEDDALALMGDLQRVLDETQSGLDALARRSYVSQVLFQQRDKEKLVDMWNDLHDAFDVLKIKLSLKLSETITAREQRSPIVADLPDCQVQSAASTPAPHPPVPPLPQLFGRAAELEAVVAAVAASTLGHVAILGGPGMGKTSLALAAMHHPRVLGRFEQRRYFVACDAAEYKADCVSVVAGAFGYSGQNHTALQQELFRELAGTPTLLVLDNFESAWEAAESRANAEQLLRAIVGLGNVALVVTLRGAERPQGVPWTRPFLAPLCPLPDDAARQTFIAISDVPDSSESTAKLAQILSHMENVPLALVLMANQAQYETLATLLGRWHDMKTAMLTRGDGKQRLNALDVSIATSLDSPRMRQRPEAERLLSLLSLLPAGAMHSDLGIWGPAEHQPSVSVLLQTALAYKTADNRLRVLAPIREFMLVNHAPTETESALLYKHFFGLPRLCVDSDAVAYISTSMTAILPELDNLEFLILYCLRQVADKTDALKAAINLGVLYSNGGMRSLHDLLPVALSVSRAGVFDSFTADLLTLSALGMTNTNMSRDSHPLQRLSEARNIYERIGAAPWRGLEASMLMMHYLSPLAAIAEATRIAELAKFHGYRDTEARCKRALASAYERVGCVSEALACHEEALAILRDIQDGPDNIMADSMIQIAVFHGEAGYVDQAMAEIREVQTVCEYLRDARCLAWVHLTLGQTFVHRGSYAAAIVELQQSLELCRKNRNRLDFFCLSDLLISHLARDDATAALDIVNTAEVMAEHYGPTAVRARSYVAWMHGELALYRNQIDEARAALMVARSICYSGNDPTDTAEGLLLHEAKVCIVAGRIEQADGRLDDAANDFILAAVVRAKFRICTDTVCALARLAEVVDDVSSAALLGATMVALHRFGYLPQLASSLLQSARLAERLGQLRLARHRAENALHYFEETGDRLGGAGARALMARVESVTTSSIFN